VSRESCDDIAQETLTRYERFKATIRSVPAWLRVVVARQVRKRRADKNRRELVELVLDEPTIEPALDLYEHDLLQKILGRLRPRDSALLTLKLGGYSNAEIARVLQVEPDSVDVKLARAKERAIQARTDLLRTVRHISPPDC
jgi:RNA polymerase sigma factor (sigma-70 family)